LRTLTCSRVTGVAGSPVNFLTAVAPARSDNKTNVRGNAHCGRAALVRLRLVIGGTALMTELWQFVGAFGAFAIAALLWLRVVYLPGRTLERWEDRRPRRDGRRD
jgi:hypothetical protein